MDTITLETVADGVARLTFDRPHRLNAYTLRMCQEVVAAVEAYAVDDALRVLIVTGRGRGFCSGADIKAGAAAEDVIAGTKIIRGQSRMASQRLLSRGAHRVCTAFRSVEKPVVAMVNGAAVSGGLAFALAADYRIAGRSARLGDASGNVGLFADEGGAWLIPRAMGVDRALRMSWLGEIYPADRALELGLVSEVVDDEQLVDHTLEFARELAARAPLAVAITKTLMHDAATSTFDDVLSRSAVWAMWNDEQPDVAEGLAAFREGRSPRFTGRAVRHGASDGGPE